MKNFRKKFFDNAYFEGVISARDFLVFIGTIFLVENFFGKPTFASHFLKSIFLGKKFMTNCSPFIGKKPRGPAGEGVQGRVWGSTPGVYARIKTKKPPEHVASCSEGTSLLHSSTVIAPNHPAFPASLASSQGYFSGSYSGLSPSPSAQFHISSYAFSSGCSLSLGTS